MTTQPQIRCHFYNRWCIYILGALDYTVSDKFPRRNMLKHLLVLIPSLAMFIISFFSVGEIRDYVFAFHIFALFHKWAIAILNMRNCEISKGKKTMGTRNIKVSSPYHKLCAIYAGSFSFLLFISLLSVLKIPSINADVVYSIVVYLSILMTFLQELLDSIVVMYAASAKIRKIR